MSSMDHQRLITQVNVNVGNDAHFWLKYVRDCSGSHILPLLGNIGNGTLVQQERILHFQSTYTGIDANIIISSRLPFPKAEGGDLLSYKQQRVVRGLPATAVFVLA